MKRAFRDIFDTHCPGGPDYEPAGVGDVVAFGGWIIILWAALMCLGLVGCDHVGRRSAPEPKAVPEVAAKADHSLEVRTAVAALKAADPTPVKPQSPQHDPREEEPSAIEPIPLPVPPAPVVPVVPPTPPYVRIGEIVGDVGEWIEVDPETNAVEVLFISMDPRLRVFPAKKLVDATSTVVEAREPGTFAMKLVIASGDHPLKPFDAVVRIRGPPAPVPPKPDPQPPGPAPTPPAPTPPTPVVVAQDLWIITIDDITKRTPATAQVLALDTAMWDEFTAKGHEWQKLNTTNPKAAKFQSQVTKNGGLPCIVIMTKAGKVLNDAPGPSYDYPDLKLRSDSAGMKALISKYAGK